MAELQNYQWEIGGVIFGRNCNIAHESDVAPPEPAMRTQDQENPGRDGMAMGIDLIEPGTWQFKLYTDCEDEHTALEALESIRMAWRGDAYRKEPGQVTGLRYKINNRTRVVFGRPRRFSAPMGLEYLSGRIPITCDFQTVSELYYEDTESTMYVDHTEPTTGGFEAPFTAPLLTENTAASQPFTFAVGGNMPTPVAVDFEGPLNSSGLLIDGKAFIEFQDSIPGDTTVTVDARPWVSSVTRADGGGVAGLLHPRSRMPRMQLEPGVHTATLLGSSPTGTGRAKLRWRSARPSV